MPENAGQMVSTTSKISVSKCPQEPVLMSCSVTAISD